MGRVNIHSRDVVIVFTSRDVVRVLRAIYGRVCAAYRLRAVDAAQITCHRSLHSLTTDRTGLRSPYDTLYTDVGPSNHTMRAKEKSNARIEMYG